MSALKKYKVKEWLPSVHLSHGDFRGKYYSKMYLDGDKGTDYEGLVAYRCVLGCNLKNALLIECEVLIHDEDSLSIKTFKSVLTQSRHLSDVSLDDITFDKVHDMPSLSSSELTNCVFQNVTWLDGLWDGVNFEGSTFIDCEFQGLTAENCNLSHCEFIRCWWVYYEPYGELESLCNIGGCNFSHSYFEGCYVESAQNIDIEEDQYENVTVVSGDPLVTYLSD